MKINDSFPPLLCLLLFSLPLNGQRSWEAGVFAGASAYLGDLAPDIPPPDALSPVLGFSAVFGYNRNLFFHAELLHGKLTGSDAFTPNASRAWSFESALSEFSLQLAWHPLGKGRKTIAGVYRSGQFSPYVFFGPGLAWAQRRQMKGMPDDQQNRDLWLKLVSAGGGMRLDTRRRWSLSLELGWRKCFSDELDGVHLLGRPDTHDGYLIGGLGITYILKADKDIRY